MKSVIVVMLAVVLVSSILFPAMPSYQIGSIAFDGDISMVQGRYGSSPFRPNFEAVIPMAEEGFVHLWRNNALKAHFHWNNYQVLREDVGHIDAVSLVQGPMGPEPGNLEFLARIGDRVAHFWRETGKGDWQGPAWLPGNGYSGTPSIANACYDISFECGQKTFEVAIPSSDRGFVYMGRTNSFANSPPPNLDWENIGTYGQDVGHIDALSLVQGRYGNNEDNLELIARVGDRLAHFYRNSGQFDWTFNGWLPGSGYSGSPSLVQGRIGEEERNMELVVPMADRGFAFLWRNGDIEGQFPWSEPLIVGRDFGHIDSISLVQSTFGENQNNIEALMRVGDRLAYVWRDSVRAADLDGGWRGPESLELFYQGERIDAPEVDIDLPQSELRKLKVTFESLYAHNSHDDRGEAHWDLIGSVNGKPVELMNDYLVPADVDLPLNVRPDTPKSVEVIIPKGQYFVLEANGRERDHTADGGDKSAFRTWFEKGDAALDTYLNEKYKDKLTAEQVANLTKAEKDLAIWNEISTELRSSDNSWVKTLGESGHAGLETYKIFYSSWIPGWGKLLAVGFAIYDFIDIVADLNPDDGLGAIRITCSPINDFCMGTHSISSQHNGNDDDSVNDYDLTFRVEEAAFTEEDFKKTTVSNNNNDDPNTSTTTMTVRAGEEIINLQVVSTSEISDFSLDEARKAISFKVDGTNGTPGFTTIPISKVLEGDYVVMIDGETTTNFATSPNEETGNTDMKISYTHSVHDITIIGTKVNPEFPFAALLAAIGIASIIAFTSRGRLSLGRRRQ